MAEATFEALNLKPNIEYIDMPEHLKNKYQYYTQAKMDKLKKIGYNNDFYDLRSGVKDYVQKYLENGFEVY